MTTNLNVKSKFTPVFVARLIYKMSEQCCRKCAQIQCNYDSKNAEALAFVFEAASWFLVSFVFDKMMPMNQLLVSLFHAAQASDSSPVLG